MSEPAHPVGVAAKVPPRWWPNPILRRYARARLRPRALTAALLVSVLISGFIFFIVRTGFRYRGDMTFVDAERSPLPFLLVIQALILFFLGTGNVAAGMTAEADEGTLEYQRLSPLTPLTKVFGFLMGLPIREWVLFASTLPFTAWCLWKGEVAAANWLPIYTVLIFSAILYHLTGLTMGTVIKNRRWAFLASLVIILVLYTVIPQAAKFGLVYFKYLTIWPVVDENIAGLLPREAEGMMRFARSLEPDVRFFGLHFSELVFTLFSQGFLALTFVIMLWRRWRRAENHLLGKGWALGVFVWLQLMLLGNALPLIQSGLVFPSKQFGRYMARNANWAPSIVEAVVMIAVYGIVTICTMLMLTLILTPVSERQINGLQRARKLGQKRIPWRADASSSLGAVVLMAIAGSIGWTVFAQHIMGSDWFTGHQLSPFTLPVLLLVLLGVGMCFQAILEGWGGHRLFLAIIFLGVLPPMVGVVLAAASDRALTPATWLVGVSPAAFPAYATAALIPTAELPREVVRAIPRAFWFWQVVTAMVTVWLLVRLRQIHRDRHQLVFRQDESTPPEVS